MQKNRYLVFSRASDNSLHREWVVPENKKNFDLFLEYYGKEDGKYKNECDFYSYNQTSSKFIRLYDLFTRNVINISDYDAFLFIDDDIRTDADTINKMFESFIQHRLWLAQPALTNDSSLSHEITRVKPDYILRYTDYVEPMTPIFSPYALTLCLDTFRKVQSGWGLDFVWPKILGYPTDKIAIIDSTPVTHTRVVSTGDLYKDITADPFEEMKRITKEYGVHYSKEEYGGITKTN